MLFDYIKNKQNVANTNWMWRVDGMKVGYDWVHGGITGVCNVTGNNTDGYVLQPYEINENNSYEVTYSDISLRMYKVRRTQNILR